MMNKTLMTAGLVLATMTAHAQVRSLSLRAPAAGDLVAGELVEAPPMTLVNERREAVSLSWVSTMAPASNMAAPFEAVSRSAVLHVDAAALKNGVPLVTDAPGAVVRLSAASGGLDPSRVFVELGGQRQALAAVSDQLVNADDLRAAGMDGGTAVVGARLTASAGPMRLIYDGTLKAQSGYTLSVFDRNSTTALSLQSASDHFRGAQGEQGAAVQARFDGADTDVTWHGLAVSPDGKQYPLTFDRSGRGTLKRRVAPAASAGLWEWRVRATDSRGLVRDARTAFAMAPAVAGLAPQADVAVGLAATDITLTVEVRSAGRFEVRGVLTGRAGGQAVVAAHARWLEPGQTRVVLSFDVNDIKAAALRGPLRLSRLTLTDQSRMSVQELRTNALDL